MMEIRFVCSLLGVLILATIAPGVISYKILIVLPVTSESHRNCFLPLATALAEKGDEITILSSLPPKNIHYGIKEYETGLSIFGDTAFDDKEVDKFKERESGASGELKFFEEVLPAIARELYNVTIVKEIYAKRKEFDLIIVDELFNEVAYPFLHEVPFIFVAPAGIFIYSSAAMGNPLNPAYTTFPIINLVHPMNFFERVSNLFLQGFLAYYWKHYSIVPKVEAELKNYFPNLPPLIEIERNVSLILSNSHFSTNDVLPLLPNQVEVGGMHCRPGKKIPEEYLSWIEESDDNGVILFSLGSIVNGTTLPLKYRNIIIETLANLKQRVIWKFEVNLTDVPSNIMISSWLPQQDILAHPKVKLFISHGGLLSIQESTYHATPLLLLPIFGDQPRNAKITQLKGLGRMVVWEELSVQLLTKEIEEVLYNPKYQEKVSEVSNKFRDQPLSPLDTAVFWTEYVIRHKGASHLRCNGRELSWSAFLYIDFIIAFNVAAILLFVIFKKLFRSLLNKCSKKVEQIPERKKKN